MRPCKFEVRSAYENDVKLKEILLSNHLVEVYENKLFLEVNTVEYLLDWCNAVTKYYKELIDSKTWRIGTPVWLPDTILIDYKRNIITIYDYYIS